MKILGFKEIRFSVHSIAVLIVLANVSQHSNAQDDCYVQDLYSDCATTYGFPASMLTCNTVRCEKEHVLDENEDPVVVNGYYVMNYDCPADTFEPIVQSGDIYTCTPTYGGDYKQMAVADEVFCIKKRACLAECTVSSEVEDPDAEIKIRKAYCKSSALALSQCDNLMYPGCSETSNKCELACPTGGG